MTTTLDRLATEALDRLGAAVLLIVLAPVIVGVAVGIRMESRGSVLFRCRRIGQGCREFDMLKFRKMHDGASGAALTAPDDGRFTRLGRFLAKSKLDELPQLWNVVRGEMSLVGPRPEDREFVRLQGKAYEEICNVKPGITGLSQLAFARESEILDSDDRVADYLNRLLPQKIRLDRLYVERRSVWMDLRVLVGTIVVIVFRREIAVHRDSGRLTLRRRPEPRAAIESTDLVSG